MKAVQIQKPMDAYTYQILEEKYEKLGEYWRLNSFDSFEQFLKEFEGVRISPITENGPYEHRLCRIYHDLDFGPDNVWIAEIESGEDLQQCTHPAI